MPLIGRTLALALVLTLTHVVLPEPAEARKTVLLVFDEDKEFPGLAFLNRSLREVFKAELKSDVDFYSESLNLSQFNDPGYDEVVRDHFRRKYAGRQVDLIVAVMGPSLDFLLRHGETLFPGRPIVFCGVDTSDAMDKALRPNITGVVVKRSYGPTLDIALRLRPETRHVFVVGGTSRFDQRLQAIVRRELKSFESRAAVTYLTGLPMGGLLERLSTLPANSAVFYVSLFADGAGRAFVPHEALSRIAAAASAPVYVAVDQYVGQGAVGGHVYSIDTHGRQAAEIGVRILRGEPASGIPVVESGAYQHLFDWRQLRRWGLDERRLPADSVIAFRTPTVWDLYKWYIVGGVTVLLLQSGLIVGLLMSRAQRRRADSAARESEQRRRQAEEAARRQRDELAHALRVTTLGELTASFAHELNQPLAAILANAQSTRRLLAVDRAGPGDVEAALVDIAEDADRAAQTIRRLRSLFRKEHTERAPLDVNALVEDVLGLLRTDMRHKIIAVRVDRAEGLPCVLGDSIQLRQVILNLLVNAEEAIALTEDGPREIHLATSRPDPGHVAVAIRDSGIGVKDDELERIFEHFVSSKPQGLGMGLAISRSIVEAHGGRLWAARNDDRGLTLHLELPASPVRDSPG